MNELISRNSLIAKLVFGLLLILRVRSIPFPNPPGLPGGAPSFPGGIEGGLPGLSPGMVAGIPGSIAGSLPSVPGAQSGGVPGGDGGALPGVPGIPSGGIGGLGIPQGPPGARNVNFGKTTVVPKIEREQTERPVVLQ